MPKRRPSTDDRWERSESGLLLPRRSRPTLPTRRHIGKLGMVKDCCIPGGCYIWSTSRPSAVTITISGITQGTCFYSCTAANGTREVPYLNSGAGGVWGASCWDNYNDGMFVYTTQFIRYSETEWIILGNVYSNCRSPGATFYMDLTQAVPFASGTTYSGTLRSNVGGGCVAGTWEIQT